MRSWLTLSRLVSGRTKMWRRVFFANYLVGAARSSHRVEEEDLEVRSTSCSAVTQVPPNLSYSNTFIRLHQEVSTPQEKVLLLSVWLCISLKIQKPERSSWRVVPSSSPTEVFAVLMSSIRWMTAQELSCTKQWSSRLCQWPKLASFVHWTREPPFWPQLILSTQSTIPSYQLWTTSSYHQLCYQDSTWYTWC